MPGIDHKVGSLNSGKRRAEMKDISRKNLIMAKKLIDTKSVVSYDSQMKHAQYVRFFFNFSKHVIIVNKNKKYDNKR